MPLGPGVTYRWKRYKNGKRVRLAFRNGKVIETKVPGKAAEIVHSKRRY